MTSVPPAEQERLRREASGEEDWRLFGPYLSERQWGTIREDYSEYGACWDYFPHDQARSRAYRWGEDGLLGFSDREGRLCFGLALWNGRDPILKERLFGLGAPEGNHAEDVKELYYYLDSTPTHSYFKALYKYPLAAYPYEWLVREGRERDIRAPEFELEDTGAFDQNRYIDVTAEYAKASPRDMVIRFTLANRSGDDAVLHVIPQLWFRNTWSWGREGTPGYSPRPTMRVVARGAVQLDHQDLGRYLFEAGSSSSGISPELIFTENETNMARLFGAPNQTPYVKDAFHEYVVGGRTEAVNPGLAGTKVGAHYRLPIGPRSTVTLELRLASEGDVQKRLGLRHVSGAIESRKAEADAFYDALLPEATTDDERNVLRQGYASLLWSRQFYNFNVAHWIDGDPAQPAPPESRQTGRNREWRHIDNHDLISVPDKWEYPWYAAWDLAFHMIPFAQVDPVFARRQLALFLSERYRHPGGQIPAYEFAFGDVNPPVHAWACLRVFEMGVKDEASTSFLASVFDPLMRNFSWWKGLRSSADDHFLNAGFLGLDNISAFDRGQPPPGGGRLEQADGTGWLAFFALNLLSMALELGKSDPGRYDDAAVEIFEEFAAVHEALNRPGGAGLWHDEDGYYYDHIASERGRAPLRIFSMAGLIPVFAVLVTDQKSLAHLPKLRRRVDEWLGGDSGDRVMLSIVSAEKLRRILSQVLDETALLGPTGVRSVSKRHLKAPFVFHAGGQEYRVDYAPEESLTPSFGTNSNWRGPVWFPLNYLLVEALGRYHDFYGGDLQTECPAGSGAFTSLGGAAAEIERRLGSTFLKDPRGRRPCHGDNPRYRTDPHFKDLVLFHEYFSGETGRGFGASHQTGWTTLALRCIEEVARRRSLEKP